MLRAQARQSILDKLEASFFGSANYIIEFDDGEPIILEVTFVPDRNFSFLLKKATKESKYSFLSSECPGEKFLTPQVFYYSEINTAFGRFDKWL